MQLLMYKCVMPRGLSCDICGRIAIFESALVLLFFSLSFLYCVVLLDLWWGEFFACWGLGYTCRGSRSLCFECASSIALQKFACLTGLGGYLLKRMPMCAWGCIDFVISSVL